MSPKRLKGSVLAALALLNLGLLLAWTQTWVALEVSVADALRTIDVTGETVAPALSALALAGLALIAAIALAGPVFRVVLAVLQALLAGCALVSSVLPLIDPLAVAAPAAIAATGVTDFSVGSAPDDAPWTLSGWPYVAIVCSALLVVVAVAVLATSRRWPASSRKYQAVRTEVVAPTDGPRDRVADWDAVTKGHDPTERAADDEPGADSR
ncbi:Trp biosynthesis-associated membrane protein [Arenivirga flava]|uniref:Trp biosynthesis protein n=1 Tax=Arenivirga flava TaxID=1930060 RepID=A0AA37UMK9_9MICO|nr:Trp biosynthesis-associated membrane protein [Arenivirga flava]GMA27576.1 hypothetical protein GCM10025874_08290 [Arenivirga flava]